MPHRRPPPPDETGVVTETDFATVLRTRRRRILPAAHGPAARSGREAPLLVDEPLWLGRSRDEPLDPSSPRPEAVYGAGRRR